MLIYNHLEQFTVNSLFSIYYYSSTNWLFDFSITNYSLTVALLIFFIITLINVFGINYQINSFFQNFIISLLNMSYQFIKDQIGSIANTLFPLMSTYLFIIFFANLVGMIPYGITLTAQLVITFFLGLTLFISLNIAAVVIHKHEFFNLFFPSGSPIALAPLIVPLEIISYFFRVISLSVRLFANMMAGHTLLKVFGGFGWSMINSSGIVILGVIPVVLVITILIGLEFAVACIQAYVFMTLSSMYFHDAFLLH